MIRNIIKFRYIITIVISAALLNSCSNMLPKSIYKRPTVDMPHEWQQEQKLQQAATENITTAEDKNFSSTSNEEQWWKNFNDPTLDYLIERALRTNNDLAAAAVRVQRALLQLGLTSTNLTPSASVSTESGHKYDLKNSIGSTASTVVGNLSYEVDLWNRLETLRDADRFAAEATEADRQSTALSLIGTTASAYWQAAYLNQQIDSTKASIGYAEKTLNLVEVKYRNGAVSRLDLVQARQSVENQKAGLSQLIMQKKEAANALSILFNQAPQQKSVPEPSRLPESQLPVIASGIPAEILRRRPDLRAAELRLRESFANIDAARLSFYPTFTLTGSLGSSSNTLINVLQNPLASLGAGVVLPFVEWNKMQLTIKVSEAEYQEAVINFRQKIYNALGEVENALSANISYHEESIRLKEALSLAKEAEHLLEIRYRSGATSMQSWLDSQESRRAAEISLAQNRLNRLTNMMKLYQALGGGCKSVE